MMNMLIKLDEERVKKDGKYDLAELRTQSLKGCSKARK